MSGAPPDAARQRVAAAANADDWRPTELDIALGGLYGKPRSTAPLPRLEQPLDPGRALEDAVLPALLRPPCHVAFSGGRDSSIVLAAAVRAAHREGLEPPIPLTLIHPYSEPSQEPEWQTRVIEHLGLSDWIRREVEEGELDFIGPWAAPALRRHGVLYPPNAHTMALMLAECEGGSIVTGQGGDAVLEPGRWERVNHVLGRRARPEPKDLLRFAFAASPVPIRTRVFSRRTDIVFDWLRPATQARFHQLLAEEQGTEPALWRDRVAWQARRRHFVAAARVLELYGEDVGMLVSNPLTDDRFLAALAQHAGPSGYGDRTALMRRAFPGMLPDDVLARETKATFEDVYYTPGFSAFFQDWDGTGVDATLVDPQALKRELQKRVSLASAALLGQQAWLRSTGGGE